MLKRILCKLTGGHRFHGAPDTFIDKRKTVVIVYYRQTCIKCGKLCEWTVPWIKLW